MRGDSYCSKLKKEPQALESEALLGRSPLDYARAVTSTSVSAFKLNELISDARMGPYLRAAGGDQQLAQDLYEWSARLSAAAFEVVAQFEVLLRNAIDREMTNHLQDLRRGIPWFLMPLGGDQETVDNSIETTRGRLRNLKRENRQQIVAHLMFGFWTGLLGNKYENLWRAALHLSFPGAPGGQRKRVAGQLDAVRNFRNRLAHHDSLLNVDIPFEHRRMLLLAEWIDPEAKTWLDNLSQVMDVYKQKPALIEDTVVVAAAQAWSLYEDCGAYVCQRGRFFRPVEHLAFYTAQGIQIDIPRIVHRRDDVEWTPEEALRLRSTGDEMDRRVAAAIEKADPSIWDDGRYQVFVLTKRGVPESGHRTLEHPVPHLHKGRGSAFTQRQRYVSLHALEVASSTDDL